MKSAFRIGLTIIATLFAAGCASTPGERVAKDVETVKEERTTEKLLERGKAFASVGDMTRAEQYLSAALDQGADEATVLPLLLRVCIAAKRYRVAIDYATPYLHKHPGDAHLRFVVASLRAEIGDTLAARAELQRVVEETPNDAGVRFSYAVLLRDQCHDPSNADEQFREYLRLSPQGEHAEEARASLLKAVP